MSAGKGASGGISRLAGNATVRVPEGTLALCTRLSRQTSVAGPLIRTIPLGPPPGAEAMAAIVSSKEWSMLCRFDQRLRFFFCGRCFGGFRCPASRRGADVGVVAAGVVPPVSFFFGSSCFSATPQMLDAMK